MGLDDAVRRAFRASAERLLDDPNTEFLLAGESGLAQLRFRLSAVNETNPSAIGLYTGLGFLVEPKPPGRTLFLGKKL